MKKILFACMITAILFLAQGCVTFQSLPEEFQPLEKRLFSSSSLIREEAVREFSALSAGEKKDIVLKIVRLFSGEKDPDTQVRMINTLRYLSPGEYVIGPLIDAVKDNGEVHVFTGVRGLINESGRASKESLESLIGILKDEGWDARKFALDIIGRMSKDAETAVPEMMKLMQEEGRDPERYVMIFDTIARINSKLAVSALIADITNKDSALRKNAAEKLFELQAYLSPKLEVKKDIVRAFIRALYDTDEEVSELAEGALSGIDNEEAKKALENYMKMGKKLVKSLISAAGEESGEVFEKQKKNIIRQIEEFYDKINKIEEFREIRKVWE